MSGMHGRKKIRTTEELQQARKEREAVKIKEYNALVAECFEKKTEKQYDGAALNITTRILHQNPDFYTVWNFRRLILREGVLKDASADAIQVSLKSELDFFMQIITINPKSYWMWNHRRWCLETIPKPAWERELALVDKMLDMDARNFHGWNYRRYVISQLARDPGMTDTQALRTSPALARSEFEFTTRKVTQNFSNYSAWHNRSKLLPIVVDEIEGEEARNEIARQEIELIKAAVYTDPDDSSVWLYRWWLIGRDTTPISLLGTHLTSANTVLLAFDDEISMLNPFAVLTSQGVPVPGSWRSFGSGNKVSGNLGEQLHGYVWAFEPETKDIPIQGVEVVVRAADLVASRSERAWRCGEVRVRVTGEVETREGEATGSAKWYTLDRAELLEEEVKDVRELLELEPGSKWALQTLARFLTELCHIRPADPVNPQVEDEVITILELLQTIDPDRARRYEDWRTNLVFERATRHLVKCVGEHGEVMFADKQPDVLDLSNLGLTHIPTPSLLLHVPRLNLKGNRLSASQAARMLAALPLMKEMDWDGNLFVKEELDVALRD